MCVERKRPFEAFALNLFPILCVEDLKLKEKQKAHIKASLEKDVLGLLPTGFGKGLISQLFLRVDEIVNSGDKCHEVSILHLNHVVPTKHK